jgi:hypothetical protein
MIHCWLRILKVTSYLIELEWCSTIGGDLILQPGDSLPLFYDFILEEQYDISRRGLYTVQFRGLAPVTKDGKTSAIPPSNTITIRMK